MKIDFKKIEITPKTPTLMSGYFGKRQSTQTKDPLYARILRVDDHIIIACDLIGVDYTITKELRQKLPHLTLDIFANHTHAGPSGTINTDENLRFMKDVFQDYSPDFTKTLINTLIEAINTTQPQETIASIETHTIHSVAGNRHDILLPFDNEAVLINFQSKDHNLALIRLALHPTYLKEDNTCFSNDILEPLEKELHTKYDEVIFIQGALGDVSTRFTRQDHSMNTLAHSLSQELLKTTSHTSITSLKRNTLITTTKDRFNNDLMFESVLYTINDHLYLGLPFEVCSPLNTILKKEYNTTILSLCNGYLAYLSPLSYYTQKEYEAEMTLFNAGEAELLIHQIMKTHLGFKR